MKHGEGTSHALIRRYMLQPATLVLAFALAFRGSYTWTKHLLDLYHVPFIGYILLIITGLTIAAMCEMLMVEGGRDVMKYQRAIASLKRRQDLKAEAKEATLAEWGAALTVSKWFTGVGLVASIVSGVGFFIGQSGALSLGDGLIDFAITAISTLAILFFLALRQEETVDPLQRAEEVGNEAMLHLVEKSAAALVNLVDGTDGTQLLAATLFRSLGGDMRQRYAPVLALLSPPKAEVDYWTMAQVYEYVGARGDESKKRQVRRILEKVAHECAVDPDGDRIVPADTARRVLASMHDEFMFEGAGSIQLRA